MLKLPRRVHEHARTADRFPLCVHDLDHLDEQVRRVRAHLPAGVELHHRVHTASGPEVVSALSSRVDGFEAASSDELERVRAAAPGAPLTFGGPGRTTADLGRSLAFPDVAVHVESPHELRFLAHAAESAGRDADVLLRVCPDSDAAGGPVSAGVDAFGMDSASLVACAAILDTSPRVRLRGFAVDLPHALPADALGALTRETLTALRTWAALFHIPDPRYALGGELGGAEFDWARYGRLLAPLVRPDETLRLVPGRSLVADSAWYLTRVLDVRHTHGRAFAVVAGSGVGGPEFAVVPRDDPSAWDAPWPRPALENERVTVVGCVPAQGGDAPGGIDVDRLRPGDVLVFTPAEAVTPAPPVRYVTGGRDAPAQARQRPRSRTAVPL